MALHWSIARVKDWKEIIEDDEQRKITEAIVWAALVYDLGGVTEKNVDEWRFRVSPQKGDIPYLPINPAARQIAMAWVGQPWPARITLASGSPAGSFT